MTRSIAITPSLIVSIIGGSAGAGRLIIIASVRNSPYVFSGWIISIIIKLNKVLMFLMTSCR